MTLPAETGPTVRAMHAIERTWAEIRHRHPDVPKAVITMASGTTGHRPGAMTLGHFARSRWVISEGEPWAEFFLGGEGLRHGAVAVLATCLHEAGHGVAVTRGIADTSNHGRYHNGAFKRLAAELGIEVTRAPQIGWSPTTCPEATVNSYAAHIAELDAVLKMFRRTEFEAATGALPVLPKPVRPEADSTDDDGQVDAVPNAPTLPPEPPRKNTNYSPIICGCPEPRRLRGALSVIELGPIVCGLCEEEFTAERAKPA